MHGSMTAIAHDKIEYNPCYYIFLQIFSVRFMKTVSSSVRTGFTLFVGKLDGVA